MARPSDLLNLEQQFIAVAINCNLAHLLDMPRAFPFFPELFSASAPVMRYIRLQRKFKRFLVHVCAHQDLVCVRVLHNHVQQTIFILRLDYTISHTHK